MQAGFTANAQSFAPLCAQHQRLARTHQRQAPSSPCYFRRPVRGGHGHSCGSVAAVSGGAGGGNYGGSGGGKGGGDGWQGGDGGADEDPSSNKSNIVGWSGWAERVAADPQFPYKVLIEQVIGVGAAVLGDMSSRPYWGLYELDFVFSTLVVGSILNFSLMYLLAPTAPVAGAAASRNIIEKLVSDQYLVSWGAPGGHMFQSGFPLPMRLVNFAYKGVVFSVVGFAAGTLGTGLSNGLLALRKKLDPDFKLQNAPPDIFLNAVTWSLHMGVSSNSRYQLLNGLDMVLQPLMGPTTFKIVASVIRTGNNILGGMSFVTLAKMMGAQSSQADQKPAEQK